MKKDKPKEKAQSESPEQVSPAEALKRMKSFSERKEKFVAAIRQSQN
ncbi:MAG TPA: hypothetical protein VGB00_17175 [Pyrinomonadaceae bacterium]|jgi:hypothetical protein